MSRVRNYVRTGEGPNDWMVITMAEEETELLERLGARCELLRRRRGDTRRSTTGIRAAVGEALLSRLRCQARLARPPRLRGLLCLKLARGGPPKPTFPALGELVTPGSAGKTNLTVCSPATYAAGLSERCVGPESAR